MSTNRAMCAVGAAFCMMGAAVSLAGAHWWLLGLNTPFFLINAWGATNG